MKWFKALSKPYIYLFPALLFLSLIVGYGVLRAGVESLQPPFQSGEWTLSYYQQLVNSQAFWDSFVYSIQITFLSTCFSVCIGLVITRLLYLYFLENKWKVFVWIPMLIPHFVAAYLVLLIFSQSGWLSSFAYQLGLLADMGQFPLIVNDRQGFGIILTYIWKEVPFVILMLLPVYYELNPDYSEVVRTLGGGTWQVFRTVEWPWLFPVVVETSLIIFAFMLTAFEVPYVLGVTYPKMLSVLAYQWFFEGNWSNRPLAMAALCSTTIIILGLTYLAFRLSGEARFRLMKGR